MCEPDAVSDMQSKKWQPIAIAPRDGQTILLLSAVYGVMDSIGVYKYPAMVCVGYWAPKRNIVG